MLMFKSALLSVGVALILSSCGDDDLSAPTIVLNGTDPYIVELGSTFTDPGATATDDEDGDLTTSIISSGTVNTSAVDIYTITYSVTDAAGNSATETRDVYVVATKASYAGTYDVAEVCEDGTSFDYEVTVTAGSGEDELIFNNFGGYGTTVSIVVTIAGDLGDELIVNGSDDGFTFTGSGTLTTGSSSDMKFSISYTADDGSATLSCDADYDNF